MAFSSSTRARSPWASASSRRMIAGRSSSSLRVSFGSASNSASAASPIAISVGRCPDAAERLPRESDAGELGDPFAGLALPQLQTELASDLLRRAPHAGQGLAQQEGREGNGGPARGYVTEGHHCGGDQASHSSCRGDTQGPEHGPANESAGGRGLSVVLERQLLTPPLEVLAQREPQVSKAVPGRQHALGVIEAEQAEQCPRHHGPREGVPADDAPEGEADAEPHAGHDRDDADGWKGTVTLGEPDSERRRHLTRYGRRGCHRLGQRLAGLEPVRRVLGEAAVHRLRPVGPASPESTDASGGAGFVMCIARRPGMSGASKGSRPRERVERHDAQRVEVAAPVHGLASRLLGTHVLRGSEHFARSGAARRVSEPRDPEVAHERATGALLEQDVVRLDVAVHDAPEVRVRRAPRPPPGAAATPSEGLRGPLV